MIDRRMLIVLILSGALACTATPDAAPVAADTTTSTHLYVWSGDADETDADFLAVIDVEPRSPTYGTVVRTVPV